MHRRDWLAHCAALGALLAVAPGAGAADRSAFAATSVDEALKGLGLAKPVESKDVTLTAPDIAENGAVMPVSASASVPGVRRIVFMVDKNPTALAGAFDLTEFVEPAVSLRLKMAQTANILAIAVLADGRVLYARKEVKVTLGGCGG